MSSKVLAISPYGRASGAGGYHPFIKHFVSNIDAVQNGGVYGCAALLLWGGRDINPQFYRQKPHPQNEARLDADLSERDKIEWMLILDAFEKSIPIIGVCRGAQMLCAFAGGALFQHVSDHNSRHPITTSNGRTFEAQASHHQMMDLRNTKHRMLAWATEPRSSFYDSATKDETRAALIDGKEPEVVWFPEIRGLSIQPHPEWEGHDSPFNRWLNEDIIPLVLNGEL